MDWVSVSLLSAFLFAIVAVLDKKLLAAYMPVRVFCFLVGLLQFLMAALILVSDPWDSSPSLAMLLIGMSSGLSWGLGTMLMFYGFSRLEVSRVIPIAHTYPVFVAIMASIFLGENLSAFQWGAKFITVVGAGLITTSPGQQTTSTSKAFVYLLVLLGSVLNAIANVTYKYTLDGIEFWDLFAMRAVCLGLVLFVAGYQAGVVSQVRRLASNMACVRVFVIAEIVVAPVAILAMLGALYLGPVSLASTLISVRPLFVLAITGILSIPVLRFLDEPFTRETLPLKLLSTSMVVAGVAVLTLA